MTAKKNETERITPRPSAAETVSKTSKKRGYGKGSREEFPDVYIRFRTVLDAMEITALRYCLKDANPAERIKRIKDIEKQLLPLIKRYEKLSGDAPNFGAECPDGFFSCGGCCVPYPCPEGQHDLSS